MLKIDKVVKDLEAEGYIYFIAPYMRLGNVPKLRSAKGDINSGVVLGIDVLEGKIFSLDFECVDYPEVTTKNFIKNIVREYERCIKNNEVAESAYYSSLGRVYITDEGRDFKSAFDLVELADKLNSKTAKQIN